MTLLQQKITGKEFISNILNAIAIGIAVALIPGALMGAVVDLIVGAWPSMAFLNMGLDMSTAMTSLVIGVLAGINFKFTPVQSGSLGLAALFASGAVKMAGDQIVIGGTGDIINVGLTIALGAAVILLIGHRVKSFAVIIIPPVLILLVGGFGHTMLPYIGQISAWVGQMVAHFLELQPLLMSILIAMIFSFLIVSPFSSVAIAVAISISGLGAGAANLGTCAAALGLAVLGWESNAIGTSLAMFIGTPKIALPALAKNPKTMIPILCTSVLTGATAYIFDIQGTSMSAGFGISGFVGPLNHLNIVGWTTNSLVISVIAFIVVPVVGALIFKYIFFKVWPILSADDYYVEVK